MMLRNSLFIMMIIGVASACGPTEKELLQAELTQLKEENAAFKAKEDKMTVSIASYESLLLEISESLKQIDDGTLLIKEQGGELISDKNNGELILIRIKSIQAMMENANMKIIALNARLNDLRRKHGDQSEAVHELNLELDEVTAELIRREEEFELLSASYEEQLILSAELKELLDKAFYFAGTRKELKDNAIIEKEGGFIGVGRVKVLNANSPAQLFTSISKEQTNQIKLPVLYMELVTSHDPKSYEIIKSDLNQTLVIKDKQLFWKLSNFLVIQTSESVLEK